LESKKRRLALVRELLKEYPDFNQDHPKLFDVAEAAAAPEKARQSAPPVVESIMQFLMQRPDTPFTPGEITEELIKAGLNTSSKFFRTSVFTACSRAATKGKLVQGKKKGKLAFRFCPPEEASQAA
jgi:hypothetical protein